MPANPSQIAHLCALALHGRPGLLHNVRVAIPGRGNFSLLLVQAEDFGMGFRLVKKAGQKGGQAGVVANPACVLDWDSDLATGRSFEAECRAECNRQVARFRLTRPTDKRLSFLDAPEVVWLRRD